MGHFYSAARCACCLVLLAVFQAGCRSGPVIQVQPDIPERFFEEIPIGPASISGKIVMVTPGLTINGDSGAATLEYRGMVGLSRVGSSNVCRALEPDDLTPKSGTNNTQWTIPFSFRDLPYGDYQVKLFRITEPDWNLYRFETYWESSTIAANQDDPSLSVGSLAIYEFGNKGTGRIKGKILVSGLAEPTVEFGLNTDDESAFSQGFYWRIPFQQNDNGRLRYELNDLPPLEYMLSGRIVEGNVESQYGTMVGLGNGETATAKTSVYTSLHGQGAKRGAPPDTIGHLDVELDVNTLDWEGDLVVVAERAGGADTTWQLYRQFITINPVNGEIRSLLRIHNIDAGCDYTVKALLLGSGQNDVQVVGEYPGLVELVVPPSEPPASLYPQAQINLDIDLTPRTSSSVLRYNS